MAYADKDNLDALTTGELFKFMDMRLIDRCLAKADALINARLGQLYGVPFAAPYPALVESIAENLALYYIYTSGFFSHKGPKLDEIRKELWEEAMNLLDKIIDGELVLTDVTLPSSASDGTRLGKITSTHSDYTPVFDVDDDVNWDVDDDLLDAIDDDRD